MREVLIPRGATHQLDELTYPNGMSTQGCGMITFGGDYMYHRTRVGHIPCTECLWNLLLLSWHALRSICHEAWYHHSPTTRNGVSCSPAKLEEHERFWPPVDVGFNPEKLSAPTPTSVLPLVLRIVIVHASLEIQHHIHPVTSAILALARSDLTES
jgi:hypothetical protein